jgi:serralysin
VFSPATLLPAREPQPPSLPPTPPPAVPKDPYWGDDLNNTLVGNAGNNVLKGFDGKDVLKGKLGNDALYGGSGNDKLYGGPGKDSFVFDTQPNRWNNKDTIYDFNVKDDTIRLENAVFTKLGLAGQLKSSAFWASKDGKAHDRSDRIIYDTDGGQLYYDADGSGRSSAVTFAQLSKNLALTYKDFYVL